MQPAFNNTSIRHYWSKAKNIGKTSNITFKEGFKINMSKCTNIYKEHFSQTWQAVTKAEYVF